MIVKIQPMDQWTAIKDEEKAIYLDVPDSVDVDSIAYNPDVFYYGDNYALLVQKLIDYGAKVIECPIKIIVV